MAADEIVETPFGKFLVDPTDVIGGTTKAGTLWDGPGFLQPIALEYGRLGEEGTTILDVGANIGTFTIWLCRQQAWRVVAVEPLAQARRYLQANLDLNKVWTADRVIQIGAAAYDRSTFLTPVFNDGWSLGSTPFVPVEREIEGSVPAYALDEFQWMFGERVSLIKIDAQGCDGAVLRGLHRTIVEQLPVIVFEWEEELSKPHPWTLPNTISWLTALGYNVHEWPSQARNYLCLPRKS